MNGNSEHMLQVVVDAVKEKKAHDVVTLNLQEVSLIADYFVICHGNSPTQVQALATEVKKKAEEAGLQVKRIEGMDAARWVLIDIGDVIVHVFHREDREYYNLEKLWSDAKVVEHV